MAYMKKASQWLITDAGKKFAYYATGTGTTCLLLAHFLPHTLLIEQYKDIFHLYKHGFSVPLTKKLQERFQKTLDLLEIEDQDRHLFKPFAAYGFDILSMGSSYSKYGVRIGIPTHFFYDDETSVDKHSIKLRGDSIVWEMDEGKSFLKSLVVSENAQIYAMAREIRIRETPMKLIETFASVVSCLGMYGLCNSINTKLNLYTRPRVLRLIMYCLVGVFSFGSYALVKDFSQVFYETKIDEELKKKNVIFAQGGKEFYSKLADRNIALRKLLGTEGERIYSILGNENYFLRYKHVPVVQRKMFFEEPL
jgi:hypothetical protein